MAEINPWMTGIGAGVSILGNGINALRSNKFMKEAKSELSNLVKNPIKPFSVSAPMQSYGTQAMSEASTPMGFSGAEKSSFDSGLGRTANSIYERSMSIGGGSGSRAIQGILSAGLLDQTGNFAAKDAMLREERRQKAINRVAGYASGVQSIDNMNVNANMNAQSDLNRSIGVQRENIGKFWGNLGGLGGMAAGYGMMGGFGGDKTTPGDIETGNNYIEEIAPRSMNSIPNNYDPSSFGKNAPRLNIGSGLFNFRSVRPGAVEWMPGDENLPDNFGSFEIPKINLGSTRPSGFGSLGFEPNQMFGPGGILSPKVRYSQSTLGR